MSKALELWMEDNAELFRHISQIPELRESAGRILLSGEASGYIADAMRTLYPEAEVTDRIEDGIDIAISLFCIQSMETRALTGYLFSIHDALSPKGVLYLAFPSSDRVELELRETSCWYASDETMLLKRYMPADLVKAVNLIGFDIRAMEIDRIPGLGDVMTLIAIKRGDSV